MLRRIRFSDAADPVSVRLNESVLVNFFFSVISQIFDEQMPLPDFPYIF
jgi:hypothetical protein